MEQEQGQALISHHFVSAHFLVGTSLRVQTTLRQAGFIGRLRITLRRRASTYPAQFAVQSNGASSLAEQCDA